MHARLMKTLVLESTLSLMAAANHCPKRYERAEFAEYQATVMQPLRDRLSYWATRR